MASATKQALLAALSAAQGECISGQQLARQLGVSRAAVHKAAAALEALSPEGRELVVFYTDNGGDTVEAGWAAR